MMRQLLFMYKPCKKTVPPALMENRVKSLFCIPEQKVLKIAIPGPKKLPH
jgi:hypothetical protein